MAEVNDYLQAIVELDRRGDLDDPEAKEILQRARHLGLTSKFETPLEKARIAASAFGAGFNRGIVEGALPVRGAAELGMKGLEAVGIPTEANQGRPLSSIPSRVGQTMGNTIPALMGLQGAANAVTQGTREAVPILSEMARKPARMATAELGSAATAGIGGALAERASGSKIGGLGGELAGGFAPAAGLALLRGIGGIGKGVATAVGRKKSIRTAAAEQLSADAVDISTTLHDVNRRLSDVNRENEIISGTVGQISGDVGLLARERQLATQNPAPFIERNVENRDALLTEINQQAPVGVPEDAAAFFEKRTSDLKKELNDRTDKRVATAKMMVAESQSNLSRDQAGLVLREALEESLQAERATERSLYAEVGVSDINTVPIKVAAARILNERRKSASGADYDPVILQVSGGKRIENVPTGLVDEFGNPFTKENITEESILNDVDTLEEVLALRSRVLDEIRRENGKAAPNRRRVRNLNILMDGIVEGMQPHNVSDPVHLENFNKAREFSKAFNDKFSRGPVADLLASDVRGGPKIAGELTTAQTLVPGQAGGVRVRAVMDALSDTQKLVGKNALGQFLLDSFGRSSVRDGIVDIKSAKRFLSDNQESLVQFPNVREGLRVAIASQEAAQLAGLKGVALQRAITQSHAARFLQGEPVKMLNTALGAKDSVGRTSALVRSAARDGSGKALEGLRRSFVEIALEKATPGSNDARVKSATLMKFIKSHEKEIQILFPGGLGRWKLIAKEAGKAGRDARGVTGSATAQNLATAVSTLGRVIGARIGPLFGAPALVSAGGGGKAANALFRETTQNKVNAVIEEALLNPRLFRDIMKPLNERNLKRADQLQSRINAFLIGALVPEVPQP
jgi:hypothetical protein